MRLHPDQHVSAGPGVVIFAHGSRVESANEAVRAVAAELARAGGVNHVEAAFLELGEPDMLGAVTRLAAAGVSRVVVIPYFLTLGLHLERDLPRIVAEVPQRFPGLEIEVAPPLDGHPALIGVLLDRLREALVRAQQGAAGRPWPNPYT